jgi:peptidyl-prolyl cis-trans isomerase D
LLAQTPFRTQQGTFDVNALKQFLNQYNEVMSNTEISSEIKEQYQQMNNYWKFIEKTIRQQTLNQKYQTLLNSLLVSNPVAAQASYDGRTNESEI